jgi:hypothetical protein
MGARQWFLVLVFGVHWLVFVRLYLRERRWTRLLPVGVFTLLILTQAFWDSPAEFYLWGEDPIPLRTALRHGAWTMAVPSVGLMIRRLVLRVRAGRTRLPAEALAETGSD